MGFSDGVSGNLSIFSDDDSHTIMIPQLTKIEYGYKLAFDFLDFSS